MTLESGERCEAGGWFMSDCDHKMKIRLSKGAYFPHCYDAKRGDEAHSVTWLPIPDQPVRRRMPMVV